MTLSFKLSINQLMERHKYMYGKERKRRRGKGVVGGEEGSGRGGYSVAPPHISRI